MKIAVCVKYVPVVSRIKFDYQRKTVIREGVPSEINPFDLLGLVRAVEMKRSLEVQVVAITMGPPEAKEGLVQCLALGADRAVLLSDRAMAGSDTLATACTLALALRKEGADLIICGRNSSDAETGQVGPQLAELLGLPHISQVRKLDCQLDGQGIVVERITDDGYQVIQSPLPAVVCVTEGVAPERYAGKQQLAEAQGKPVEQVSAAQLSSDLSLFGSSGSPTWVADIRLVEPDRLGVVISEPGPEAAAQKMAQLLQERMAALGSGGRASGAAAVNPDSAPWPRYPDSRDKSIWVVAETLNQGLRRVTLELLGKARQLAATTRSEVVAILLGPGQQGLIDELAAYGADRVLVLKGAASAPPSRAVVEVVASAMSGGDGSGLSRLYVVLFASTPDGRDLASRVSARLGLGLTGDAIELEINEQGRLEQLKPALGGNVVAPILSKTLPNMVTLRPGLLAPIAPQWAVKANVESIEVPSNNRDDIKVLESHHQEVDADELVRAQVVLGVGKGIGGPENLPKVRELARSIGASLAATRDVVHAGWLPAQIQVGTSGRTIAPRVYIAVGIRGMFNHTVGIQKAGVIIALNQNPRAAIFKAADYGIAGDWQVYLPLLVEALKPVLPNSI